MFTKKMSARMLTLAGATALALGGMSGTQAATEQADLEVTATVTASCTIATTAVDFGAYDPVTANLSAAIEQTGEVTVACTNGSAVKVTLGQGLNPDSGATSTDADPARRMKNAGTDYLSYTLYSEGTRTTEWGNTALTGLAHTGTGTTAHLTVYGTLPGGQNVPVGSYSDTVVATVTF
jgi:spore coat protein U-like protein